MEPIKDFIKVSKILNENNAKYSCINTYLIENEKHESTSLFINLVKGLKKSVMHLLFDADYMMTAIEIYNIDNFEDQLKYYITKEEPQINKYTTFIHNGNNTDCMSYIDDIINIIYKPNRSVFEFADRLDIQTEKGFKEYLKYDDVKYTVYGEILRSYTVYNRFNIPIEVCYKCNKLYCISIIPGLHATDITEYTGSKDIPSIIVSSLINYIIKV